MALRVAIVNDDELVVRGLASMLQHRSEVECVTDLAAAATTDIVLFDPFTTGGHDRTLERLVADPRVAKVVVYTWNFQPWTAGEWIGQGAAGYLSKTLSSATLVEAMHAIQSGRTIVAPGHRGTVAASDWAGQEQGLTRREAQILSLIAAGMSNADVAERSCLSINSVKSYIRSCYRKIDAESRSQAVLWAVAHGVVAEHHDGRTPAAAAARSSESPARG